MRQPHAVRRTTLTERHALEMLGHSTIGLTLDRYNHVHSTVQRHAIETLEAVLSG